VAYILAMIAVFAAVAVWAQSDGTAPPATGDHGGIFTPQVIYGTIDAGSLECTGNPLDCVKGGKPPKSADPGASDSCAMFYGRTNNE
jgi:hypothetical protein